MKRKLLKVLLTFGLAVSLSVGLLYVPEGSQIAQATEVSAKTESRTWDFTAASAVKRPTLEGAAGEFDSIQIDATNGKFSPRKADTQINAGTVLTIPVEANSDGAILTMSLSGGSAEVTVGGEKYISENSAVTIPLEASEEDSQCQTVFVSQAYVASIELSYNEPAAEYPGTPESAAAEDVNYTFTSAEGLLDESGNAAADDKLEGNKGTFADLLVDATNGKFNIQSEQERVVINAGTVVYIPAAYDSKGAELLIAGTQDGSMPSDVKVNGKAYKTNAEISLDMSDASAYPQYLKVEFDTIAYVNSIAVNYASDSDYDAPAVQAKDKVWDFTENSAVERPTVQGTKGEFDGIQIDAVTGKFAPRTTVSGGNDTQISAGTTLYIPVAPDEKGASITVAGNNYNNLTLTLDGEEFSVGTETALPAVKENSYVALEFSSADGTGSCYLYNISVDYMSDHIVNAKTVTVGKGAGYDYSGIQAALDANESSASSPLVIMIAPGTYSEKVTVDKPWVSFQSLDKNGGEIVIEESYYSSNTFGADGQFLPQDEYDLGTDQCGTVLLTANATGFSAEGITFQNSYNVTDHTAEGEQTPAVAFGSAADRVYLKDCRFIGRQDTLYLHGAGARVQAENCYIEGTVDFVFGDADAYFVNCELHMAGFAGRDTGYFTAANTKKGDTGLVFYQCALTVDDSYGEGSTVSLGRPWQTECYTESERTEDGTFVTEYDPDRKNPSYENTASSVTFIECRMDSAIQDSRWNAWTRKNTDGETLDVTYHDDVHFAEYNSMDENGRYLDPADYQEIELGIMEQTEDAREMIAALLGEMGFGEGIGNWTPSLPEGTAQDPGQTPGGDQEDPGQTPGAGDQGDPGQNPQPGTGETDPVGNAGDNGSANIQNPVQGTADVNAVQTGDTANAVPYAAALLAAAAILLGTVLRARMRRK